MSIRFVHIQRHQRPRHGSRGIVLPIVLIMLLVLTIASLVVVGQISSQTRMAANAAVDQVSLQAAEALLRNVSNGLESGTVPSVLTAYQSGAAPANNSGLYQYSALVYPTGTALPWNNSADWAAITSSTQPDAVCPSTPTSPITSCKYIVEKLPSVLPPGGSTVNVYRITAQVIGLSGQGTVILQTLLQLPQ